MRISEVFYREQTCRQGEELGGGLEVWDWQMQTIIQRTDEQQGPTV